jgi:hypothetical protein
MAGKIGAAISARGRSGAVPPGGYCYLALGPIDQPDWTFAIAGDELPLTAISWRAPSKPAVFLLSVARSIANEHKTRMAGRSAAIIRRRIDGVTSRGFVLPAEADEGGHFVHSPCATTDAIRQSRRPRLGVPLVGSYG